MRSGTSSCSDLRSSLKGLPEVTCDKTTTHENPDENVAKQTIKCTRPGKHDSHRGVAVSSDYIYNESVDWS